VQYCWLALRWCCPFALSDLLFARLVLPGIRIQSTEFSVKTREIATLPGGQDCAAIPFDPALSHRFHALRWTEGLWLFRHSPGMAALLCDYATGDAVPGVPGGICLVVIGFRVDYDCCTAGQQRVRAVF